MARRATNQNLFVVLLPPVRRLSLGGEKKYIYIDLLSQVCDLCTFFPRRIGQYREDRIKFSILVENLLDLLEKNSWVEITDIDSGRRMITMMTRRVDRDEFGVTKFAGKKKERNNSIEIKLFSRRNEVDF